MKILKHVSSTLLMPVIAILLFSPVSFAADYTMQDILRQGLLGAGTGAISAESSGGNAGKGALIGMGVGVIGNVLLGILTEPSASSRPIAYAPAQFQTYYTTQSYYQPQPQQVYYQPPQQAYAVYQPRVEYVQAAPAYSYYRPQGDTNRYILRQGLLGAGVGAISAGASGGKAGTGALIGAGTNVIGGALLSYLTS